MDQPLIMILALSCLATLLLSAMLHFFFLPPDSSSASMSLENPGTGQVAFYTLFRRSYSSLQETDFAFYRSKCRREMLKSLRYAAPCWQLRRILVISRFP